MTYRKPFLFSLIIIFLTAFTLFWLISISTDYYNWAHFINFSAGGVLGYTVINRNNKVLAIAILSTILLVIFTLFFFPLLGINYVSIILTVAGFFFGRYLEKKL